jgi:hypothetical protein
MSKIKAKIITPIYTLLIDGVCSGDSLSEDVTTYIGANRLEKVRSDFKATYEKLLKTFDAEDPTLVNNFDEKIEGNVYEASFEIYYEGYYSDDSVIGSVKTSSSEVEIEVDTNDLNLSEQFWFNEAKVYATRYLEDNKLTLPEETINEICEKIAKSAPNNEYLWDQIDFAFGSDVREAIENKI